MLITTDHSQTVFLVGPDRAWAWFQVLMAQTTMPKSGSSSGEQVKFAGWFVMFATEVSPQTSPPSSPCKLSAEEQFPRQKLWRFSPFKQIQPKEVLKAKR